MLLAGLFVQEEPTLGDVADAFEFVLHLRVFGLHDFGGSVSWNVQGWGKQDDRVRERHGQKKMVVFITTTP